MKGNKRVCDKGHVFYKSSDCNVCPKYDQIEKPSDGFLSAIASPIRRALLANGVDSIKKLAQYNPELILNFHGIGPGSIPKLEQCLINAGLDWAFKQD